LTNTSTSITISYSSKSTTIPAGHAGHLAHVAHLAQVAQAGHLAQVAQAGHLAHVAHAGHVNHWGHLDHVVQAGHASHWSHLNHVGSHTHCHALFITWPYHFIFKPLDINNHEKSQYHRDIILLNNHNVQITLCEKFQIQAFIFHVVVISFDEKLVGYIFLASNLYHHVVFVLVL